MGAKIILGDRYWVEARKVKSFEVWLLVAKSSRASREGSKEGMARSIELLQEALAQEPDSPQLNAWMSGRLVVQAQFGFSPDPRQAVMTAKRLAERAIELAPEEPEGYSALSRVYRLMRNFDRAVELSERAVALAPSDAGFLAFLGMNKNNRLDGDSAVEMFERSLRLNPLAPDWFWENYGESLRLAERYDEAIPAYEKAIELGASGILLGEVELGLAVAHDALGDEAAARDHVRAAEQASPFYSLRALEKWPYPEDYRRTWVTTLQRLGLREG